MDLKQTFQVAEIPRAGLVGRLLGRVPREAVFVEIRNLLATTPFADVKSDDVSSILASGKLTTDTASAELLGIFEEAICILFADKELGPADRLGLLALRRAFGLSEEAANGATERAVGAVYTAALREALADGKFTPDKRAHLDQTAAALGMSEGEQRRAFAAGAHAALQSAYNVALADGRLGVGEEEHLDELARSLGANVQLGDEMANAVRRARLLGQIDEGLLPQLEVELMLPPGEVCHFIARSVAHAEMRVVTKRVNYSGPVASVRIMKGVRWRVGSISTQRVTDDVLTKIDTGNLFITNRKIFFQGATKKTSIDLRKMVQFHVFRDGIQIEKQTGKDLYCIGAGDWELAGACLNAAVSLASE